MWKGIASILEAIAHRIRTNSEVGCLLFSALVVVPTLILLGVFIYQLVILFVPPS